MYLCHVDELASYRFVADALKDPSVTNRRIFTDGIKMHVDSVGSEDHDVFGIGDYLHWKVTDSNSKELLNKIKTTVGTNKEDIIYKEINGDDIPSQLSYEFGRLTGCSSSCAEVACDEITYGALRGHEIAGFLGGKHWQNLLSMSHFFVGREFRYKGIGKKLIWEVVKKARSEKLAGVDIDRILWSTVSVLESMKKKLKADDKLDIGWWMDEEHIFGELRFTDYVNGDSGKDG